MVNRVRARPRLLRVPDAMRAIASGTSLIRDRHNLETVPSLQNNRKKQGPDQPARRSRRCFGSLILRRREAPSRRMRRAIPLPSCFETHRSAVRQWKNMHSCRAAMLLSMRARARAFCRNEPKEDACLIRAKNQPAAVGNDRRRGCPVSGLFFTGSCATRTCEPPARGTSAPHTRCAPSPHLGERAGVRGLQDHRQTLTPHPTPLPMGEGADRVRRSW
jgi:hypothetical protein